MKKILCLVMSLCLVLALCACGSSAPAASDGIKTVVPGKLTVATSPDFAPYEFYAIGEDGTPSLAGFDIALAQYIADYLGLELDVVPMDFDGVLNELAAGSVDLGVAGLSPDPDRAESMDFSDIYYEGGQSFVTVKDKAALFTSLEDTNKAEYSIGAQNGSIQMDLANENSPDADIVSLTKVTDIIAELIAGTLDGAYIETAVAETYAKNYPDLCVVLPGQHRSAGRRQQGHRLRAELRRDGQVRRRGQRPRLRQHPRGSAGGQVILRSYLPPLLADDRRGGFALSYHRIPTPVGAGVTARRRGRTL